MPSSRQLTRRAVQLAGFAVVAGPVIAWRRGAGGSPFVQLQKLVERAERLEPAVGRERASVLSIGSFASILSIGCSNSVLSLGRDGGCLTVGRRSRRDA
jgi:hypothetical protein